MPMTIKININPLKLKFYEKEKQNFDLSDGNYGRIFIVYKQL